MVIFAKYTNIPLQKRYPCRKNNLKEKVYDNVWKSSYAYLSWLLNKKWFQKYLKTYLGIWI